VFLGEYQHSIDAKGRLAVPARFRAQFERGGVITRGTERCLQVFPLDTFERKAQQINNADLDERKRDYFIRQRFGMAELCELDAQGRIIIPLKLRKYAEMQGEALVIGAYERFEIWHPAHWEAYLEEMRDEDLSALRLPF
jgi:MraZ protein